MKTILILAVLCLAGPFAAAAHASGRAVSCDGCSAQQMAARATATIERGTVYVFDARRTRVRKYAVVTEVIDTQPWSVWKQAIEQAVEPAVSEAWEEWAAFREDLSGDGGRFELGGDFPIRSVAGALLDPGHASTAIEDYLAGLSNFRQLELSLGALLSQLIRSNIPMADLQSLLKTLKITVVFPDGSTLDYALSFSIDVINGEARAELDATGNARLPNGQPAPTAGASFDGMRFDDRNGSLREWILLARQLGLVVSGPNDGTSMTCTVSGDTIHCRVTKNG